jgi:hypothetical protein
MNVEIGAEASLFPEKEYINWIFVAVLIMVYRGLINALNPKKFWETLTGISNGWVRLTVCIIFIVYNFTSHLRGSSTLVQT